MKEKVFDTNNTFYKLLKFLSETSTKGYEICNVVSETGESIYSPPFEELPGGQIFYSESRIREIVRQELEAAIGVLLKSKNE